MSEKHFKPDQIFGAATAEVMNDALARIEALEAQGVRDASTNDAQWLTIRALRSNAEALEAQVRELREALEERSRTATRCRRS